jgi:anhydro-N-acetylmuramic acid kinase
MKRPLPGAPLRTIGLLLSSAGGSVRGALVGSRGRGLDRQVEIAAEGCLSAPPQAAALLQADGASTPPRADVPTVAARLAEVQALLIDRLLAQARLARDDVALVAVHDPGRWYLAEDGMVTCDALCDAARLAELAGVNVLDAFPVRDLAAGGLGGPVTALAEWVLLGHPLRSRALVHLGRSTRITWLPSLAEGGASRVLSFEAGPGLRLLDSLARRLTGGIQTFDPGGRLAVQGRPLAELLAAWLHAPLLTGPLPRWQPAGIRPEEFLEGPLSRPHAAGARTQDLLCTATHFVAASIAAALARDLPRREVLDEVLVAGGGQQNGLLIRELRRLAAPTPLATAAEAGVSSEALASASVAVLAALWVDQTPATRPEITGADLPRVLGRLTPGPPQAFQRLLERLQDGRNTFAPLQSVL